MRLLLLGLFWELDLDLLDLEDLAEALSLCLGGVRRGEEECLDLLDVTWAFLVLTDLTTAAMWADVFDSVDEEEGLEAGGVILEEVALGSSD